MKIKVFIQLIILSSLKNVNLVRAGTHCEDSSELMQWLVGATKPPFINFSISDIYVLAKES